MTSVKLLFNCIVLIYVRLLQYLRLPFIAKYCPMSLANCRTYLIVHYLKIECLMTSKCLQIVQDNVSNRYINIDNISKHNCYLLYEPFLLQLTSGKQAVKC